MRHPRPNFQSLTSVGKDRNPSGASEGLGAIVPARDSTFTKDEKTITDFAGHDIY